MFGINTDESALRQLQQISSQKPYITTELKSIKEQLLVINERLSIIPVTDYRLAVHECYPALKEAYDHYKLIEALCTANEIIRDE